MFDNKTKFFARWGMTSLATPALALAAALLAACTLVQPPQTVQSPQAVQSAAPASAAGSAMANGNGKTAVLPAPSAGAAISPESEPLVRVLAYSDRVRSMSGTELNQEIARLGNAYIPANQLQLALVLAQLRQTPELIRAQELLTRLLANADAEAQALHPLARLLASRYGEQRRLEDLLEKQNQQTREVQRRLDQTHERLEALKAIERSLTSRPHSPAAAPVSRNRTPASAP